MMLHTKSSRSSLLKLLALLPIVGITLALNARTVTDYVYQQPKKKIIKKGKKDATVKTDAVNEIVVVGYGPETTTSDEQNTATGTFTPASEDKVFDVVEQMPQFSGGIEAMLKYLAENVRYPKEAEEKSLQGRVIATFVVEKDGSISRAKVVKSVDPLLDEEALRVVNSMPNWTPGRQNGEPVAVKYTIPISFRLQGESEPASESIKIGPHPNAKDVEVVIDGKVVDVTALNSINPDDIASMNVEKAKDGAPKDRIIITTKKK